MANSYRNEISPARINIQLSVDNGGVQKKMDGDESRLMEREKMETVLKEFIN